MTMSRRHFIRAATASVASLKLSTWAKAAGGPAILPAGACDSHIHIIGPSDRYPMEPDRIYTPPEASVSDLLALRGRIGVSRNVVIQPSFYGTDNRCLLDSLDKLGDTARGIAVLPPDISTEELKDMDRRGIRGVRANLETNGSRDLLSASGALKTFASRIAPLGWHLQIYAALNVIAGLADEISAMPVPVVIDHFGMPEAAKGVGQPGFDTLLSLVRSGRVYVKLSAPYRISKREPDYADVEPFARALIEAGPKRMLWATDWPHTAKAAARATDISPFRKVDDVGLVNLLSKWCPDAGVRKTILVDTPASLYRF